MRAVGIKILKNRLSEYVRLAAQGEVVLVTDRDRVVAELGPPHSMPPTELADALVSEGIGQGWLRPALLYSSEPPAREPVAEAADLTPELSQDRQER